MLSLPMACIGLTNILHQPSKPWRVYNGRLHPTLRSIRWRQLPEQTRKAAQEAAHLLGSLLYRIGAHSLSIGAMAEGKPHTLTITLNKKNAD